MGTTNWGLALIKWNLRITKGQTLVRYIEAPLYIFDLAVIVVCISCKLNFVFPSSTE